MALNSDRDGFLVPDQRLSGDDLSQGIKGIKRNTDAILSLLRSRGRALERARATNPNSQRQRAPSASGSTPRWDRSSSSAPALSAPTARAGSGARSSASNAPERARDSRGRFISQSATPITAAVRQFTRQQAQQAAEQQRAEAAQRSREGEAGAAQPRDARGRFGSGGSGGGSGEDGEDGAGGSGGRDKEAKDGLFSRLKDILSDKGASIGEVSKVDPAIESAKEVMGMVGGAVSALKTTGKIGRAVLGRGISTKEDRATPWYKKIFQQLKLMRRGDSEFQRAELHALDEHHGESDGGGGGWVVGLIMSALKLLFSPVGMALVAAVAGVWATIGDKISGAWSIFVDSVSKKWDTAVEKFMGIWEPIAKFFSDKFGIVTNAGNAANSAIKNATGVDIKAGVSKAADVTAEKAGNLIEKLNPGYRHKATFDGIKGGQRLQDEGSYTGAEADRIRALKSSGADTSANPKGGMSDRVRDKIIAQAKAAGLDPAMMLKFASVESGGNPNAVSATGAIGVMQLTGATASGLGVKDRFSEDDNIAGGIKLAKQNTALLTAAKLPVTAANLYMMHQLGPNAAKEVIRGAASGESVSDLSAATQAAMGKNVGAGSATAAEYIGKNSAALDARYSSFVPGGVPVVAGLPSTIAPAVTPSIPAVTPASAALSGPPRTPAVSISTQVPPPPVARADTAVPLSSKAPLEVTLRNNDRPVGQDVKDRRLAHIATGGMSE